MNGWALTSFGIFLSDPAQTAFSTAVNLPTSVNLSAFSSAIFDLRFNNGDSPDEDVIGVISSIDVVPTSQSPSLNPAHSPCSAPAWSAWPSGAAAAASGGASLLKRECRRTPPLQWIEPQSTVHRTACPPLLFDDVLDPAIVDGAVADALAELRPEIERSISGVRCSAPKSASLRTNRPSSSPQWRSRTMSRRWLGRFAIASSVARILVRRLASLDTAERLSRIDVNRSNVSCASVWLIGANFCAGKRLGPDR